MGNAYYRYQFIADLEEAFQLGEINFPEWDALTSSWPPQIEAVHYGCMKQFASDGIDFTEEFPGDARDEAEDAEFCGDFVVGCSDCRACSPGCIPISEEFRTYTFPEGHQITVGDVCGMLFAENGAHYLETALGEKFWISPGFLCIEIQ